MGNYHWPHPPKKMICCPHLSKWPLPIAPKETLGPGDDRCQIFGQLDLVLGYARNHNCGEILAATASLCLEGSILEPSSPSSALTFFLLLFLSVIQAMVVVRLMSHLGLSPQAVILSTWTSLASVHRLRTIAKRHSTDQDSKYPRSMVMNASTWKAV